MKEYIITTCLCCLILIVSCDHKTESAVKSDTEVWDSVKLSTYHFDYLRFMINFTDSRYFDTSMIKYFEYQTKLFNSTGPPISDYPERWISIAITSDTILFEEEPVKMSDLKGKSLEYLINKTNNEQLPGQKLVKDKNGTERLVSDGYFFIQANPESAPRLRQAIKEMKSAYHEYKNYLAKQWYDVNYDKLSPEKKEIIEDLVIEAYELWPYTKLNIIEDDSNEKQSYELVIPDNDNLKNHKKD